MELYFHSPNVFMAWCLVKHRDNFTFLCLYADKCSLDNLWLSFGPREETYSNPRLICSGNEILADADSSHKRQFYVYLLNESLMELNAVSQILLHKFVARPTG
jgi:hypothetical protein